MENQTDSSTQPNSTLPGAGPAKEILPNSTAVLILGILSIIICCFLGLIMAIIALVMASRGKNLYEANPGLYSESSWNNMKAGRICAIVGLILSLLVSLYYFILIAIVGAAFSLIPWEMCRF